MWKTVSFLPPAATFAKRRPCMNLLVLLAMAAGGCATAPPRWSMPRAVIGDSPAPAPLMVALWEHADFTPPLTGPIVEGGSQPSAEPGPWTTRAKFAWDPNHLYVLVESVGPRPASPFTRHDELLHQADAIELFLDVTGTDLSAISGALNHSRGAQDEIIGGVPQVEAIVDAVLDPVLQGSGAVRPALAEAQRQANAVLVEMAARWRAK